MCKCRNCEMLSMDEPILIVDIKIPLGQDICHFEEGYKCLYNGTISLNIDDLCKNNCRLDPA